MHPSLSLQKVSLGLLRSHVDGLFGVLSLSIGRLSLIKVLEHSKDVAAAASSLRYLKHPFDSFRSYMLPIGMSQLMTEVSLFLG